MPFVRHQTTVLMSWYLSPPELLLQALFVCLSVIMGGTHHEHTWSNQPPVPDDLIRRPLLTVVAEIHSLLGCWIMLLGKEITLFSLVWFPWLLPSQLISFIYRPSLGFSLPGALGEDAWAEWVRRVWIVWMPLFPGSLEPLFLPSQPVYITLVFHC